MKYKMAVLDIDGTIFSEATGITKRTKNIISKLVKNNIPVCICTGRTLFHTLKVIKELGIKTPFICLDGTLMYDPIDHKMLYENKIPIEIMREIICLAETRNVFIEFLTKDKYIKYIKNAETNIYNFGGAANLFNKMKHYFINMRYHKKGLAQIFEKNSDIHQLWIGGDDTELSIIKNEIAKYNCDNLAVREDLWQNYLYICAKGINKLNGVNLLCSHYGIDISEVVAIGDELNDLEMIQNVGMGVAMGNANERLKAVAKHITGTVFQDGAAEALEKLFIKGDNTNENIGNR